MTFPKAKIWKCHFFVVPLQAVYFYHTRIYLYVAENTAVIAIRKEQSLGLSSDTVIVGLI